MIHASLRAFWRYILLCAVLLASCQAAPPAETAQPPTEIIPNRPEPSLVVAPTSAPAPTRVVEPGPEGGFAFIAGASDEPLPVAALGAQPVVSTEDPLRFVFPTPRPAAISAWRPPLYPTPWAPTPVDHFFFTRPIAADEVNWPLADYRYGGVFFEDVVHTGVDIPSPTGTPVLAAGSGKVTWAGYGLYALKEDPKDPYGLAVAIKHDFGYDGYTLYTVYGHLNEILIERGQVVEGGQMIGVVGETGKVTGPHLHFEVRLGKNNFFGSRNPELWISPPQGWGVLAGRVMGTNGRLLDRHKVVIRSLDSKQWWDVQTYGKGSTNSDAYYNENVVMGDLPAGSYSLWIDYLGVKYEARVDILPGMVTYFTFKGRSSFGLSPPPLPGEDYVPAFVTPDP
jgi:murein DD-endopeptidase MepM/ murein hydrolase activator NlpD